MQPKEAGPAPHSRILIVKLTSVGDVLHAVPAVSAIRRRFPDAHLSWLVDYRAADVVAMTPDVDEIILLGRPSTRGAFGTAGAAEHLRALRRVRAGGFDTVVDMQGLLKSAVFTYCSGAATRIGFGNSRFGTRWATNVKTPLQKPGTHAVDAYCEFARLLGGAPVPDEFALRIPAEHAEAVEGFLSELGDRAGPLVALVPGSAWPSKQWPPQHFAELARRFVQECEARIVVLGHSGDAAAALAVTSRCPDESLPLAGRTTLGEAIAVAARCDLAIGGDTGLVQIAAALGVPTVAIYGPTDPALTGPVGPRVTIIRHEVDCWPCRERRCDHWECMVELAPETVFEAATAALQGQPARST